MVRGKGRAGYRHPTLAKREGYILNVLSAHQERANARRFVYRERGGKDVTATRARAMSVEGLLLFLHLLLLPVSRER